MKQTDIGTMRSVLLKHARDAFSSEELVDSDWRRLGYLSRPDREAAIREFESFANLIAGFGIEVHCLPASGSVTLDSIYTRDSSIATDAGMVLCSMGKEARRQEPEEHRRFYESAGLPILGEISGEGRLEGGDVTWLTPRLVAIADGYRTNQGGIRQLTELLGDHVDEVIEVALPHFRGPTDVFHLMSIISPVASDLAVVYSPLMPVPFRNRLLDEGFRLVEVPDKEFDSMGCNVLAVAPGVCVMSEGNPVTERRLLDAGAVVHTYRGEEISRKGCGGPTCLTRPLERETPA